MPDRRELALATNRAEATAVVRQMIAEATGVKDLDLSARIIGQVSRMQTVWPFGNASEAVQAAGEMMLEIKPENLMEALLATQAIGVHHAALSCLLRTALPVKAVEDVDTYARVATRLMRLYMEQEEAMAKLKGKTGRQKSPSSKFTCTRAGRPLSGR